LKEKRTVYNITVETDHEYFANGILVANCDSLRYCTVSIPWDFSRVMLPENTGDKNEEESGSATENRWGDAIVVRHTFEDGEGEAESIEDQFSELNDLFGG